MNNVFFPGSKWIYLKIYTGVNSADKILADLFYPFICKLLKTNIIEKFFFIRYTDPEFHLRLRLKLFDIEQYSLFYKLFNENILENNIGGLIWKLQIDTYIQEIERYGVETIDFVENVFFEDSLNVINIINNVREGLYTSKKRNLISFLIVDLYLDQFNFSLEKRLSLCKDLSQKWLEDLHISSKINTRQLDKLYRSMRNDIDNILLLKSLFSTQIIKKNCNAIIKYCNQYQAFSLMESIIVSLIHMSMNRLFVANNNLNEVTVYYLLNKYYAQKQIMLTLEK